MSMDCLCHAESEDNWQYCVKNVSYSVLTSCLLNSCIKVTSFNNAAFVASSNLFEFMFGHMYTI